MIPDHIEQYSAEEWSYLRKRFFNSILTETELSKLGKNVGIAWPFRGRDETPTKYIDYDFEALHSVPGLVGKKRRVQLLMDILRETLAFDDPFADMVETVESDSNVDDVFERILAKLEIPTEYPAELIHLSADSRALLQSEGVETLIQAIHFGQNLARNVVIGGDLKSFLNGLAQQDAGGIIKHLPYRRSGRGLHLAEAVGLIVRDLDESVQIELLHQSGVSLSDAQQAMRQRASKSVVAAGIQAAMQQLDAVCAWFTQEAADLQQTCSTGGAVERYFVPIDEPFAECVAAALARAKFGMPAPERRGLLGQLSGLLGR
jgi:hypothetical protein